jgi:uncharacterized protein YndB with AHSA1/START domain
MKTKTIKQTIIIKASAVKIFDAFMNAGQHQKFTGYKASIKLVVGGRFLTCGNRNYGFTLFLGNGRRIIQAWTHKDFPDNHYSVIDIKLSETKPGITKLTFCQFGAPLECAAWLTTGWKSTYWAPLKEYLEKGTIQKLRK